jgi:hypothetical protein
MHRIVFPILLPLVSRLLVMSAVLFLGLHCAFADFDEDPPYPAFTTGHAEWPQCLFGNRLSPDLE